MQRRNFLSGLFASVAGLFGAKTARGALVDEPAPCRVDVSKVNIDSDNNSCWPIDLRECAVNGLAKVLPFCDPNSRESRQQILRGIMRDLEEYGRSMLWAVKNEAGVTVEVHRVLLNWWHCREDGSIPVNAPDVPSCKANWTNSPRFETGDTKGYPFDFTIPKDDIVFVEIPEDAWRSMRFQPLPAPEEETKL